MKNQFINIPCGSSDAKETIYNNFERQVDPELYNRLDDHGIPIIYYTFYRYILLLQKDVRPIVFSPDYAISSSTISAISEKYMVAESEGENLKYTSPVKIIYLTPIIHVAELTEISPQTLAKSVLSNVFCSNDVSFTRHKFVPSPQNIILLGLNDSLICSDEIEKLNNDNVVHFTLSQIRKKGIDNILEHLQEIIGDDPVYFVYDMSVISAIFAPAIFRFVDKTRSLEEQIDGLSDSEITSIFKAFEKFKIVGLDIMGYNLKKDMPEKQLMITSYCAKLPLIHLLKIKEKKINVFNNDTKFLIFRPRHQENNRDIGWYILKGASIEFEEKVIKELELIDDNISIFMLDSETPIYVSTTSVAEQKAKSFYTATSIHDCALIPEEEQTMILYMMTKELSNVPAQDIVFAPAADKNRCEEVASFVKTTPVCKR